MASLKTGLYLGVCLSAWIITSADENFVPKAENVRWVSVDFTTILHWTTTASDYKYTVLYTGNEDFWMESFHCIQMSETACDLSTEVKTNSTYNVKIKTVAATEDDDYDNELDKFPHSYSPPFNPFRETNISAVNFTVQVVDESRVNVTITDPLSGIHEGEKQLSLRDIFKSELKYKISYYKFGSTGKRDIISDSSTAEVSELNAGQSYCFMVAAFIPTRPKSTQQGAWSAQTCIPGDELSLGAWVGAVVILLTFVVIVVTVIVLCCKCCQQNNPSQSSTPV
ncbi:tissue factor-like [Cyclopterus lumpus]|uniref:Tissue factor n=1 Tax=Cyclopterus lumpus TaxID=8103 RepID=A0A8C2Z1M9_CYCLU|nr:tissue factor-like [Cyclopterus lumpus]